jgi:hypothetical protein
VFIIMNEKTFAHPKPHHCNLSELEVQEKNLKPSGTTHRGQKIESHWMWPQACQDACVKRISAMLVYAHCTAFACCPRKLLEDISHQNKRVTRGRGRGAMHRIAGRGSLALSRTKGKEKKGGLWEAEGRALGSLA